MNQLIHSKFWRFRQIWGYIEDRLPNSTYFRQSVILVLSNPWVFSLSFKPKSKFPRIFVHFLMKQLYSLCMVENCNIMREVQSICKKKEESMVKLSKACVFPLSYWGFFLDFWVFDPLNFFKMSSFKAWFKTKTETNDVTTRHARRFNRSPSCVHN